MKRYGPLVAILAVIAVISVVVIVAGRGGSSDTSSSSAPADSRPGEVGLTGLADVPMTFSEAKAQGKDGSTTWADDCDPATGKLKMPSVYAPPCLPKFTGDNRGATSPGVTGGDITIVDYVASANGDINALFGSAINTPEDTVKTETAFLAMLQDLYQTYGRKVNLVQFQSQSAPDDATGGQADAVTVAEKYHPFASINGPTLTPAYAEEMARRKILCIECGLALPDQFYQDHQPYIWGGAASPEEFLVNVGDFITKGLVGRKAKYAGEPDLQSKDRVFGTVSFDQDPPVFTGLADLIAKCGAQAGTTFQSADAETYLFDISKMPDSATTIIAKLKAAGVTTVVFLGDPVMPIYLTKAATAQNFHPEWIITGTVYTDSTLLGRLYDQDQWRHAFGLSNLGARIPQDQTEPYLLHQWYYGQPPAAQGSAVATYGPLNQLMEGIYMAGPKLTPETFKAGLFHLPEAGGQPTNPHVSYGDHGYFKQTDPDTCKADKPRPDYLATDDVTEIWWDADQEGPDEQGKVGKGMMRYVDNGKRYLPDQIPNTEPDVFNQANTVTIVDPVPDADKAPTYPALNKPLPPT